MRIINGWGCPFLFFMASLVFGGGCLIGVSQAQAATEIFRSVGPSNTTALVTGTASANNLSITGSTAVFTSALPYNVGVGDVMQYDSDNNGTLDAVAFIYGRTDSKHYTVKSATGAAPTATSANDVDWAIYRAYTSLSNAEAGTENTGVAASLRDFDSFTDGKDLVAADQQWTLACYADDTETTDGIQISGWATDDTHYLKIYTPYLSSEVGTSQRHSGVWSDTKYRIVSDNEMGSWDALSVEGVNVQLEGLQIYQNETLGSGLNSIGIVNVGGTTKISHNILRGGPDVSNNGIYLSNSGATDASTYKIWNNIIYNFTTAEIFLDDANGTAYVYNNTAYGTDAADKCYSQTSGSFVSKNNIAQHCANGFDGTFAAASDYNLSDLSTDAPGSHSQSSKVLTFDNSNYLHLAASDAAVNAGVTLAGDSNLSFSQDIDNDDRASSWDMGADEVAGADPTPAVENVQNAIFPYVKIGSTYTYLGSKGTFKKKTKTITLEGKKSDAANGKVKIYRNNKYLKTKSIDANGAWSASIVVKKFNRYYKFKFVYYNSAGQKIYTATKKIRIKKG